MPISSQLKRLLPNYSLDISCVVFNDAIVDYSLWFDYFFFMLTVKFVSNHAVMNGYS